MGDCCDTYTNFAGVYIAAGSGKSADPILHRVTPLLKHRSDAMSDYKN
jgi:hypothetical protein